MADFHQLRVFLICCVAGILSFATGKSFDGNNKDGYLPPSGIWGITRHTRDVAAPNSLKAPLRTQYVLLTSGGPTDPYERSFKALELPINSMWDHSSEQLYSDIQDGIRYVLQTENRWTFALHGTGTTGTTAVLDNLIEPGDSVVVGVIGHWGTLAADIVERLGGKAYRLKKPLGSSLTLKEIEAAVKSRRPKVLFLVNGESSTGVYQNIDSVGDLCRKYGCISVVDTVATIGQLPIKMDERKIDVMFMNTQKGLGGVVGLSPCSISSRAINVIKARNSSPRIYQTDFLRQGKAWNVEREGNPHTDWVHSVSMPLLYMLREAFAKIADEGIDHVWERHQRVYNYFVDKMTQKGLELYVRNPAERLPGTITFNPLQGKDPYKIASYIYEKYKIDITPGLGPTLGKVIRVGLFGPNANETVADKVASALDDAIHSSDTNSA